MNIKIDPILKPVGLTEKVDSNLNFIYNKIQGKKVFIFDLETTGLFDKKNFYKYWDNSVFNSSRIVEIGYYYSDNFDGNSAGNSNKLPDILEFLPISTILPINKSDESFDNKLSVTNINKNDFEINNIIHSYLRKPTDFNYIDPIAESKHGININQLKQYGYKFSQILNKDLLIKLNEADYIISHNTMFDFYILLNELNRFKLKQTISHLLDIKTKKHLLCTCKSSGFQTLEKLYFNIFDDKPTILHRAGDDVKTLVEIISRKKINTIYKTIL